MVAMFQALGEPHRHGIVEFLKRGPRSVNEIVGALGLRQPQVSKHLQVLSHAGLLVRTLRAQQRIYSLRPDAFEALETWLDSFRQLWEDRLDVMDRVAREVHEKEKNRTQITQEEE